MKKFFIGVLVAMLTGCNAVTTVRTTKIGMTDKEGWTEITQEFDSEGNVLNESTRFVERTK